jgi:hypothetical protein
MNKSWHILLKNLISQEKGFIDHWGGYAALAAS